LKGRPITLSIVNTQAKKCDLITSDPVIDAFSPSLLETHKAANKVKAGKAPGSCGVYIQNISCMEAL